MNMKIPEFNVKKLVKEAGSTLSRVVQVTYKIRIYIFQTENYILNNCSNYLRCLFHHVTPSQ